MNDDIAIGITIELVVSIAFPTGTQSQLFSCIRSCNSNRVWRSEGRDVAAVAIPIVTANTIGVAAM